MNKISAVYSRRSVRGFKPEQLKKAEVDAIIGSGLWAPSAMNTQNWHFTVIQNADLIRRINEGVIDALPAETKERMSARNNGDEDFSVFYFAPTVVIVSGDASDKWSVANCSYATQNMVLTAEELGVGSCIVGMLAALFASPNAAEFIKELGLPEGYQPFYAVSFGYKSMDMPIPERLPGRVNFIV